MILTISSKVTLGYHPQSLRASLSSMLSGQESAIFCLSSGLQSTLTGTRLLTASASCSAVKEKPLMLQLVLTLICYLSACMIWMVPLTTSSMYIIGRVVFSETKQVQWPSFRAAWKISMAQSVVPPPGSCFQLMIPGYLKLRMSSPNLLKQYWASSSPVRLVTPYIVTGSMIVDCGVFTLGVVGPKVAIELAQNTFWTLSYTQRSRMPFRDQRLTLQVRWGFFQPAMESRAARWQSCVTPCLRKMALRAGMSVMSAFSRGPSQLAGMYL